MTESTNDAPPPAGSCPVFLKRHRTRHGAKDYASVLLVQWGRVGAKRPPGRPSAGSAAPQSVVAQETLPTLSRLPSELSEFVERFCRGEQPANYTASAGERETHVGPCYGVLPGLHALGRELGIVKAVGEGTRTQRLALYLIYARLFCPGESAVGGAGQ